MVAAKITQEEKDSTRATVDEDRKHAIEAAIVKTSRPTHMRPPVHSCQCPRLVAPNSIARACVCEHGTSKCISFVCRCAS